MPEQRPGEQDPRPEDIDAQFEAILAGWDQSAPTSGSALLRELDLTYLHRPGPLDEPAEDEPHLRQSPDELLDADTDESTEPDTGWRRHTPPEVEEHFEPPVPTLPPAHDATYWLAVAGLTLGPLLVVWAAVLSGDPDPGWWVLIGILATIAGFGLVVLRGSGERDPDDDGARV